MAHRSHVCGAMRRVEGSIPGAQPVCGRRGENMTNALSSNLLGPRPVSLRMLAFCCKNLCGARGSIRLVRFRLAWILTDIVRFRCIDHRVCFNFQIQVDVKRRVCYSRPFNVV